MTPDDPLADGGQSENDRVFVLRFWLERAAGPQAKACGRAKVSNLTSGEEKHVNGVDAALDHVRRIMRARTA